MVILWRYCYLISLFTFRLFERKGSVHPSTPNYINELSFHKITAEGYSEGFDDFKNKQKSLWSNVFDISKKCIFWKCIQSTIYWDKIQMLKKLPADKISIIKNALFFFCKLQLITVLLLLCEYYMSWTIRFVFLKVYVQFSISKFVSFLLRFIFLFKKIYGPFNFKTS